MNHIEEQHRREGIENSVSVITLAFTILILAGLTAITSCLFAGCGTIDPNADPMVVQAERASQIAYETFDAFLKLEYDNRPALLRIDPRIHDTAELIRCEGVNWISDLREATKTYKKSRDPTNQAKLNNALTALQSVLTQVQKHMERSNNVTR